MFWAPLVLASGYIGFAQYAAYLVPALGGFVPTHLLAAAVGVVTLAALYRAIPQIARTALVLGGVALVTLVVVALAGLTHPHAPLAQTLAGTFTRSASRLAARSAPRSSSRSTTTAATPTSARSATRSSRRRERSRARS